MLATLAARLKRTASSQQGAEGLRFASLAIGYLVASRWAIAANSPTIAWLPNSLLLCVLLRTRHRLWPAVVAAAALTRALAAAPAHIDPSFVAGTWAIEYASVIVVAWSLRIVLKSPLRFKTVADFALYCGLALLAVPICSASAAATLAHAVYRDDYWRFWSSWFLGMALTTLVATPFVNYWLLGFRRWLRPGRRRLIEALLLFLGLLASVSLAFGLSSQPYLVPVVGATMAIVFLLWSAVRFGIVGATGSVALIVFVSVIAALYEHSPLMGLAATPMAAALVFAAAPLYFIGILTDQLKRAQAELLEKERRYRELVESQTDADTAELKLVRAGRLSTVGHITALVAHELNQPLAAIISNAEAAELTLASGTPLLPTLREIIGDIRQDGLRAATTIDRVQGLVRNIDPHTGPVDVNEAIHDSLRLMRGDLASRGVRAVPDLAASLPPVTADKHALQEVLINLIANAIDAMEGLPDAKRVLTIRTAWHVDEIEVDVSDRGPGIDGHHMHQIFEPFFTTKPSGTGLGLSLSSKIIRKYSGRIWATNNHAGGATFRFTLPIEHTRSATNAERTAFKPELRH